ncbi:MAG: PQQ-binding-like beta-propeller repeat protein [Thermoplasmata archaeon]|nr:MAG: PQQ-binding-like beta-propeller repeat protein [Thermoplasmata archaeon]
MRLCNKVLTYLLLGSIIVFIPTTDSDDSSNIEIEVMIDLGNGKVEWSEVTLSTNHTAIKATEEACNRLNLSLTVSWSQWGAFVSEIGGISPTDYSWWWGFYIWNHSEKSWESSSVGASSLELNEGDIIGWSPNWNYVKPVNPIATPSMQYPWTGFQYDGMNSGSTKNFGPRSNAVSWIFDTQTKELAASPAIADGRIVVNNLGGTFCLSEDGELLWKNSEVKAIFSPTIGHGQVLVGGKDGYLYSLNITNGDILWKTQITRNPGLSGVTSPSKIVRGKIYLGSYDFNGGTGYLYCLNEENGQILWKNTTFSSVYFSSPAVHNDKVFVGIMGLYNSSTLKWGAPYGLYCFNCDNGELLWNYSVNGSIGSSPTVVDDKVLFTSKNGYLFCLDVENGDLFWKKNIGSSVSSPAVWKNIILVGSGEMSGEGGFYSLDMNGNMLWQFEPNGAVQSSPAIAGDLVYFTTNVKDGTIYCLDNTNGELVWMYKPWPEEYIISSCAIVDGSMYVASDNGRLYRFYGDNPKFIVNASATPQKVNVGEDVIFVHNDKEDKLIVTSISQNAVTLKIDSIDNQIKVNMARATMVDTDSDGIRDMMISIDEINSLKQTATLILDDYHESKDEGDNRVFLVTIITSTIIAVVIIFGIVVNLKRKK